MKSWYDRVAEKCQQLDAKEKADRELLDALWTNLNNHYSNRDGEQLTRQEGGAAKRYKGQMVFWYDVKDGQTTVNAATGGRKTYADVEEALDWMAELMANTVRDPGSIDGKADGRAA
jgi:hypothetical protein